MGEPGRRRPYKLADGTVVASVTTILSRFKESGALIHWSWDQGRQGVDYRATRDHAATAGTLAHMMAEAWFRGQPQRLSLSADGEVRSLATTSFQAFLSWAKGQRLRPAVIEGVPQVEVRMVSERHRYGGMMDASLMGEHDEICLFDMKTSGGLYVDYLLQLAAYGALWDENNPGRPITGGYHLVRFDKVTGGFAHHWWPQLMMLNAEGKPVRCIDQFLRLLECYHAEKAIKKLLK